MGGLENILQKIEQDALDRINAINDESAQKVKALKDEIITKANAEAKEIVAEANEKAARISEGSKSNCETYLKRQELAAKSAVINSLLAQVKDKLKSTTDEEYFEDLKSLILKYAMDGTGELILSKKDADRLPKGFVDEVNKKLEGKSVKLSDFTDDNIDGGLVIKYGEVEQNCTFDALIDEKMYEIKDNLYKLIGGSV